MPHATTFVTIIGRVLRDDSVHTEGTSQLSVCIIVEVVKMRTGSGSDQGGHTGCDWTWPPTWIPSAKASMCPMRLSHPPARCHPQAAERASSSITGDRKVTSGDGVEREHSRHQDRSDRFLDRPSDHPLILPS